jgi:hypothetical protein
MKHLIVWARLVAVLQSPRRAACFSSLERVLQPHEKGNTQETRRPAARVRTPCDRERPGAHNAPIRRVHCERRRLGRHSGRRARPLRSHPPPSRAGAEGGQEMRSKFSRPRRHANRYQERIREARAYRLAVGDSRITRLFDLGLSMHGTEGDEMKRRFRLKAKK